jgi:hypothetical protein
MAAYLQMGDNTENLVGELDLDEFIGVVLSPVNRKPSELQQDIITFLKKRDFDIIIDPQLYVPGSQRGCLSDQPYFPSDIDTADAASDVWWTGLCDKLESYVLSLGVNAVASPAVLPNVWSSEYYSRCADTARYLRELLPTDLRVLTTVMVDFKQLGDLNIGLRIGSIVSDTETDGYYLVIVSDIEPRRELTGEKELSGVMSLIRQLENTGRPVLVSHCSADMVLFKAAGATHCATGKYFNLRRFTRSRYDDETEPGGKLIAYWFEQGLLAFLRGADLLRILDAGFGRMIGVGDSRNQWSQTIQDQFASDPEKAWVKYGWRQYLSWFGKAELKLSTTAPGTLVQAWLVIAEQNWLDLEDAGVFSDEPRNQGQWVRSWRQAFSKFRNAQL